MSYKFEQKLLNDNVYTWILSKLSIEIINRYYFKILKLNTLKQSEHNNYCTRI